MAGTANLELAKTVASGLGVGLTTTEIERFPDGEVRPTVRTMRGDDVFVIQPTTPAVNENLVELALLVDACRRSGAERVTAVVPYFGYARQDRRDRPGQGIGARVALGVIATAGADRLVVVDPHPSAFEAMCPIPIVVLTATTILIDAVRKLRFEPTAVVAPDLGAAKLAERFGTAFQVPVAVVRKSRQTGTLVRAEELVGSVDGRRALIVDDMISTGATVEAAVQLVQSYGGHPEAAVATHGLFVGAASDRLDELALRRVVVTDTAPAPTKSPSKIEVVGAGGLLADAIGRLHHGNSLDDLSIYD